MIQRYNGMQNHRRLYHRTLESIVKNPRQQLFLDETHKEEMIHVEEELGEEEGQIALQLRGGLKILLVAPLLLQ